MHSVRIRMITYYVFFDHSLAFSGFCVLLAVYYSNMIFFPAFYSNSQILKKQTMKTLNYRQKVRNV
jgi:hypothetical protein